MNEEQKIQCLIDLIDDDNEQSASLAMGIICMSVMVRIPSTTWPNTVY